MKKECHLILVKSCLIFFFFLKMANSFSSINYQERESGENKQFGKNEVFRAIRTVGNDTELCQNKTNELLKYLLNPANTTFNSSDIQGIFFYSGSAINDYGDYTNCISDSRYNYILASANSSNTLFNLGLCYYKECTADYFNTAKGDLIQLINYKYNLNLTGKEIKFQNPKGLGESAREQKVTGLIVCMVIMGIIGLLSLFKLFVYNYNSVSDENLQYKKLIETETNTSAKDINSYSIKNNIDNEDAENEKSSKAGLCLSSLLKNFDIVQHAKAIFKVENNNKTFEYLRVLDGVRFLSTCWVVWGHVFFISVQLGVKNLYEMINLTQKWYYCILTSAVVSVDVFFFMSGFLVYFNLKKYLKEKTNKVSFFFMALLQRYIRLLPFYLIAIFVLNYLLPFLIDGPQNQFTQLFLKSCDKYWWHNLLYLQNFFNRMYKDDSGSPACVGHSWYLADDMLYFIFATIIILLVYNKTLIKNLVFICTFIGSCVWQIYLIIENNYSNNIQDTPKAKGDYFTDFYIQPLARITPYMLGLLYCELFFETDVYRDSDKHSKTETEKPNFLRKINIYLKESNGLCIGIFLFSLVEINYGVFINYVSQNYHLAHGWEVFFITFNKIFFINGLGNIIHLIYLEKFGIIKDFLSMRIFSVLSKITYGVYILHFYVVMIFLLNSDTSYKLNFIEFSFYAMGIMAITIVLSFICGLLYESPVISMLKYLRSNKRRVRRSIILNSNDGNDNNLFNEKPNEKNKPEYLNYSDSENNFSGNATPKTINKV